METSNLVTKLYNDMPKRIDKLIANKGIHLKLCN